MCGDWSVSDLLVNVALFIPLGIALAFARAGRTTRWLLPLTLAIVIEAIQLTIPGRFTTLSDIATNTFGALLGAALPRWAGRWVLPRRAVSRRILVSTLLTVALVVGSAWLDRTDATPEPNFSHWVPDFENRERWTGEVTRVRIGDSDVPGGWLPASSSLGEQLARGAPVQVSLVAGRPSESLAIIFALTDPGAGVTFEIGVWGDDVLARVRHKATDLRLTTVATRFEGAFAGLAPGESLALALSRESRSTCLTIQTRHPCVADPGVGGLWRHFYAPDGWSNLTRRVLDLMALALLVLPVAVIAPQGNRRALAFAALLGLVGISVAAAIGPVSAPRLPELLALAAGVLAGHWMGRQQGRAREHSHG